VINYVFNITQNNASTENVDFLTNWATLIGFLISIITLIWTAFVNKRVNKIKRFYAFHLSIQDHIDVISSHLTELKNLLRTAESNEVEIKEVLIIISEQMRSLKPKLNSTERRALKILDHFIKKKVEQNLTIEHDRKWVKKKLNYMFPGFFKFQKQDCWSIYHYAHRILNNLKNLKSDHDLKIKLL